MKNFKRLTSNRDASAAAWLGYQARNGAGPEIATTTEIISAFLDQYSNLFVPPTGRNIFQVKLPAEDIEWWGTGSTSLTDEGSRGSCCQSTGHATRELVLELCEDLYKVGD
jgi:hypothetical protein